MAQKEYFSSRWGLLLVALGMALGTGNLWRFPRIIAQNGGGTFLIPWLLFLFTWSIPLLIIEFSMGKGTRKGTVGAFTKIMGPRFAWMGAFVGFCAIAIMFYYSVVSGWCIKYAFSALTGSLAGIEGASYFDSFIATRYQPVFFHFLAISIGALIIYQGVVKGIEKANRIFIPALFVIIIIVIVRTFMLDGAMNGLNFIFKPDFGQMFNHKFWLNALTQSAWSTGAGWGLLLTIAVYMRKNEDIALNSFVTGLGDNAFSLLAAIAVIPIVFAVMPSIANEIITDAGPLSTGMTFVWIPKIFDAIPGGIVIMILFFMGLSFAALSSLISMIELFTRIMMDGGMTRKKAVILIWSVSLLFGIPSAVNINFFANQDWVWGVGLMVSGMFFASAVIKYGPRKFREEYVNVEGNDFKIGVWFDVIVKYVIPIEFIVMISWWLWQAKGLLDIFSSFSVGTCLFQWGIVIIIFLFLNKKLARYSTKGE